MLIAALLGIGLGFITAVPVAGPVSGIIFAMCLRHKNAQARRLALGAGVVEGLYCFIAFWGFNRFLVDLKFVQTISNWIAALLLSILGIYFFKSKKLRQISPSQSPQSLVSNQNSFLLGAGLSFVNPTLIVTWSAGVTVINSMRLFDFNVFNIGLFSIGVSFGITLWFLWMIHLLSSHKNKLNAVWMDRALKFLGTLMLVLAGSILFAKN